MKFVYSAAYGMISEAEKERIKQTMEEHSNILPSLDWVGDLIEGGVEMTADFVADIVGTILLGILKGIGNFFVDMSGAVALVGGGIFILLRIAGLESGYKWAGVLFTGHVLIKYLLGG